MNSPVDLLFHFARRTSVALQAATRQCRSRSTSMSYAPFIGFPMSDRRPATENQGLAASFVNRSKRSRRLT
jgi:hypothetical protein